MKIPSFTYHRPTSVDGALALLEEHGDEAKVLAGGQSLLPVMALRLGRPEHVIDIGNIEELRHISFDDGVTIGALVTHSEAERSTEVAQLAPLVAEAMPHIGHRAIRNRGTVVGSIAHADSAAEMPAVCLAAEATMTAASVSGTRNIEARDFFEGFFMTALEPTELLTAVSFPEWSPTAGASVAEISRRHGDYAMVGVAAVIDAPDGIISRAALAFFGVASTAVRVAPAEEALVGQRPGPDAFHAAAHVVADNLNPAGDIHATAAYRRHIARVLTERSLASAAGHLGAHV